MSCESRPLDRVREAATDWLTAGVDLARSVWRQVRPNAPSDGSPTPGCERVPLLLLPGILEPWTWMVPMADSFAAHGHPVHHVEPLGWNLRGLQSSADRCLEVLQERDIRRAVIVAHSKGGLIGKAVLARTLGAIDTDEPGEGAPRAVGMVTVATPFGGSSFGGRLQRLPLIARSPLGMFLPGSEQLADLTQERAVNAHIVSLSPAWDQVIPEGSYLEGATNVDLDVAGHFRPIREPAVWDTIHEFVHTLAEATAGNN